MDWFKQLHNNGFPFPNSYLVVDIETTGLEFGDYILQFGCLVVEDGKEREELSTILNWPDCKIVNFSQFNEKLRKNQKWYIQEKRREPKFTIDKLKTGVDPVSILATYLDLFRSYQDTGGYFLTHNGYRFDMPQIAWHFNAILKEPFNFNYDCVLDTGLLEKGLQIGIEPNNKRLSTFHEQISRHRSHAKWSLSEHCVNKYKLREKHALDMTNAHTADFDCRLTHLLFQEFRERAYAQEEK